MTKPPPQGPRGKLFGASAQGLEELELVLGRNGSVSDQVHDALRRAIIEVRLAPGAPISENSICRQFAVSRTPVRSAIQRLSEGGLVDILPQRGSYVAPLRLGNLRDSHFIRRSLELALLHETAAIWTPEMSQTLRDIVEKQRQVIAAEDPDGFFLADEEFHRTLAGFSGRAGVWDAIQAAKVSLTRFYRYWAQADRLPDVLTEHLAVLDALDRGDVDGAEEALATHLDMAFVIFDQMPEEDRKQLPV